MALVTAFTAEATQEILDGTINGASINGSGHLILTTHDSSSIDAGLVQGPAGDTGATGAAGADGDSLSLDALATANPTLATVDNNFHRIIHVDSGVDNGDVATIGQVALLSGAHFSGAVVEDAVTLTFATTILIDASAGNTFRVTLTASTGTLGAPSNPTDNQKIIVEVAQDATGGRTMAYNAIYEFTTDNPSPTLTTTASKHDKLIFIYRSSAAKWQFQGANKGYSV